MSLENNVVPIVEPEILLDGNHTTTALRRNLGHVWQLLFDKLKASNI